MAGCPQAASRASRTATGERGLMTASMVSDRFAVRLVGDDERGPRRAGASGLCSRITSSLDGRPGGRRRLPGRGSAVWLPRTVDDERAGHAYLGVPGDRAKVVVVPGAGGDADGRCVHPG